MRPIDADALMDYCNNQKDKTIDANDIARFPTVGGWISVKDRLPEEDGQYLVCLNKTRLMVVPFAKTLEDVDSDVFKGRDEPGWFEWDTEWCGFYEVTMVTHWMPIPGLLEEGEQ